MLIEIMGQKQPVAFLSYVRSDDENENGRLTQFCERLSAEVEMQTGEEFPIFQDRKDIILGQNWKERLENTLDEVTFLIPIITPSFFTSTPCREEFKHFLEREKNLNRNDLILPIYYVSSPLLEIKEKCAADEIATIIASRQHVDWRDIRFEPPTAPEYGKRLEKIAIQIRESLECVQPKVITPEPKKSEADTDSKMSGSMSGKEKSIHIKSTSSDPIFNVPSKNIFFTGREEYIEQLHDALKLNGAMALSQPQAISGLGGIGKTQTAIEYAYKYKDEYRAVFWVNADSKESIISSFVKIAGLLNLPVKDDKDQELIAASVKHWLETNSCWLMIFDNADDPKLVEKYFSFQSKGHIILTSRAQIFSNLRIMKPLKMDEMSPDESKQFLLRRTGRNAIPLNQIETDAIEQLGKELDYFPLALEQAGAFIHEKSSGFHDYLISYRKRGLELLEETKSDMYPKSIATTWSLNFEQVKQTSNASIDLLYVSAFLSPYSIPLELISHGAKELGPALSISLTDVESDPVSLNKVLEPLSKYSLISLDPFHRTYSIHRMVQAVLKDKMDGDTRRQWTERTIKAVDRAFPDVEFKAWDICEKMIPHAKFCLEQILKSNFEFQEAARLLNKAGKYLKERALFSEAKDFFEQALDIRKKILVKDHPDLAETFNDFAGLYKAQGKYKEAEVFYNNALDIRKKILVKDHPDLAETYNDFAGLYQDQGKYTEAEDYYNNALNIEKKVLGEDHPDLGATLNNLGLVYKIQGKYKEAEEYYNTALYIEKKVLGNDHPDLATTLNNLGTLYQDQGKYKEAEDYLNTALNITKKVLGEDHPDLAKTLYNLGLLYYNQTKYSKAKPLFKKAIDIMEKSFGKESPLLIIHLTNYANFLQKTHKNREATKMKNRVKAIQDKQKSK
jgi:tetratricopeptide (TPR) repeat protein